MKPPQSLPSILKKLEGVKRTSSFDDLVKIVVGVARLKAQGRIRAVAETIRPRLWDEAKSAGRLVFKRSCEFAPSHNGYSRIDLVVRELMIAPPEDTVMPGITSLLPSPEKAQEVVRQIKEEPFRCSPEICVRLQSLPPDFVVAGQNLKSKDVSDEAIATDFGLHVLALWWAVRFDCVALAIAETIVAIDDGTIDAVAVAPDGTTEPIPRSLLTTSGGWRLIVDGSALVEQRQTLVPGVRGAAEAGIYIFKTDPVELIREGPPSKLRVRDKAIRWLRDQVNLAPHNPRRREDVEKELAAPPWDIGSGTFRTVWREAMKQANPGHSWSDSGRKGKPSN